MAKKNTGFLKWLVYCFARLLIASISRIPIQLSARLGNFVGGILWHLMPKRRRIVEKNLAIITDWASVREAPLETSDLSSREVFRRTCGNLIAGFSFGRMHPEKMKQHLQINGTEHVHDALSQERGVILILAHMGPWELLTAIAALGPELGIRARMAAIYRPLDNDYLDAWVRRVRQQNKTTLFSRKDGFYKPSAFIKEGNILGILSDQRASRGPKASFFGKDVPTTPLPGLLHQRTGAPMIGLAVKTVGLAKWRLTVSPITLSETIKECPDSKELLARAVNKGLEENLSKSPNDVFWFHNRFR